MGSELIKYKIEDIALEMGDAPFGSNLKNVDYTEAGALVVQGKNVQGRTFDWSDKRHVSFKKWKSIPRSHCFPGDLIFPKVGTIGKVGVLNPCESYDKYLLSTNAMRLKVDPEKANQLYVYYYFTWNRTVNLIHAMNSKSVQPVFNYTSLKKFPIELPSLDKQNYIANILGTLDDKIELNRQINQTLEHIAQAIFKSWFIDFEPVKAKIEAKINGQDTERATMRAISGLTNEQLDQLDNDRLKQLTATAALFPDELEESELGKIPKGWKVGVLGDICTQAIGGQWGSDAQADDLVPAICLRGCDMADVRDSGFGKDAPVRYLKQSALDKRSMSDTDLLIAASGAGPCGRPLWCSPNLSKEHYGVEVIYSNFVKRFNCSSSAHAIYIDHIIYEKYKAGTIGDYIIGTSVPNLDASGLLNSLQIVIPEQGILNVFSNYYKNIEPRNTNGENRVLAEVRDSLLPKLLSGTIEIEAA